MDEDETMYELQTDELRRIDTADEVGVDVITDDSEALDDHDEIAVTTDRGYFSRTKHCKRTLLIETMPERDPVPDDLDHFKLFEQRILLHLLEAVDMHSNELMGNHDQIRTLHD